MACRVIGCNVMMTSDTRILICAAIATMLLAATAKKGIAEQIIFLWPNLACKICI
jgi:hypothetical protein